MELSSMKNHTKTCNLYFSFSDVQATAQIALEQMLSE